MGEGWTRDRRGIEGGLEGKGSSEREGVHKYVDNDRGGFSIILGKHQKSFFAECCHIAMRHIIAK